MRTRMSVGGLLVAAVPGLLAGCAGSTPTRTGDGAEAGEALERRVVARRVVDLTHALHDAIPIWPGGVPFEMERLVDYDEGYRLHAFHVGENTGTHLDAPAHFVPGARTLEELSPRELVAPAVAIDVRDRAAENPDLLLRAEHVRAWEAEHGRIPEGAFVILNTGWHERWSEPARYVNRDDDGTMHYPGFGESAAELLRRRGVAGLGIDTLSLDRGTSEAFPTHHVMMRDEAYLVENLANLDALPPTGATVVLGVLPVRHGTQAQARVLALLP